MWNFFTCSTRERSGVAPLDCRSHISRHVGIIEAGGGVRVDADERHHVGPSVADRHHTADESALNLDGALDVRRRHVLARRVDDELLLAVDDGDETVCIDRCDVTRVQPAVGIQRRGRLLRCVAVAPHDSRTAQLELPVLAESHLDAGKGGPYRSRAGRVSPGDRADQAGLRHAPALDHGQAQSQEEFQRVRRDRCGTRGAQECLVQPEPFAQRCQHQSVCERVLGRERPWGRTPVERQLETLGSDSQSPSQQLRFGARLGSHGLVDAGLELVPDQGDPEDRRRSDGLDRRGQLLGVRQGHDFTAGRPR